jgi:hypothetical protein
MIFQNHIGDSMRSLLTAVTALFLLGVVAASAQSKLEIEGGETYDWGQVKQPESGYLEAEIKMKNVGDRTMKLVEIKPGCGCTKTDPDKYEVEPGDASTMKVRLNISPSQAGPITKSITIRWGDKDAMDLKATDGVMTSLPANADTMEKVAYLFLKADVQRALMISPAIYFSFNNLEVGKETESKLTITNNTDQPMILSGWDMDNGIVLNVSDKVVLKPHDQMDLIAKVVPATSGNFSGQVKFKTNHPDHADMTIHAYGYVKESASPVFQKNAK